MKLECTLLEKSFGRRQVVNGISLHIIAGQFGKLLGFSIEAQAIVPALATRKLKSTRNAGRSMP